MALTTANAGAQRYIRETGAGIAALHRGPRWKAPLQEFIR